MICDDRQPGIRAEPASDKASRRMRAYTIGTDPQSVERKTRRKKGLMRERYAAQVAVLEQVDDAVRAAIDWANVSPLLKSSCLCFGREVYGCWRRWTQQTLVNELAIVVAKWYSRSLGLPTLERIRDGVLRMLDESGATRK
jgi:hypothetical protein